MERDSEAIHLLIVTLMMKHHGYERLIKEFHEYYQVGGNRKVICDVVGDGVEGAEETVGMSETMKLLFERVEAITINRNSKDLVNYLGKRYVPYLQIDELIYISVKE